MACARSSLICSRPCTTRRASVWLQRRSTSTGACWSRIFHRISRNRARSFNPEILEKDGIIVSDEGCLSVPGYYEEVERAEHIRLRYLDRNGDAQTMEAEGLLAVCIQHEIDHLDGKLFVDYLSEAKRLRIRKKLTKERRQQSSTVVI